MIYRQQNVGKGEGYCDFALTQPACSDITQRGFQDCTWESGCLSSLAWKQANPTRPDACVLVSNVSCTGTDGCEWFGY
jgi:hypothetical protein